MKAPFKTPVTYRQGLIKDAEGKPVTDLNRNDLAFMIIAINSHEALVEALEEARIQITYLHGRFRPTGSGNKVLAQIDAALALAKGETK